MKEKDMLRNYYRLKETKLNKTATLDWAVDQIFFVCLFSTAKKISRIISNIFIRAKDLIIVFNHYFMVL